MRRRRSRYQKRLADTLAGPDSAERGPISSPSPIPFYIAGAGKPLKAIVELVRAEYPELAPVGILDPDEQLHGDRVAGLPVLGWLSQLPSDACAVAIATPAVPGAFDREAVFQVLVKRGVRLPVLCASESRRVARTTFHCGATVLPGASIAEGVIVPANCLLGARCRIDVGRTLSEHQVVSCGSHQPTDVTSEREQVVPRSLATALIAADTPIHEAIRRLNQGRIEIVLVTDDSGLLIGALTDGDIRRGILAGVEMRDTVAGIMNPAPVSVPLGVSRREMVGIMRGASIRHLPVVDEENRPVRIEILEDLFSDIGQHDAVIMAGGLGSRLRPFTDTTPKPLLAVQGKPILDHMLARVRRSGLLDVVISVNYLADEIMKHVGDGTGFGLNVGYLSEPERMGTAGSLAKLHPRPTRPFLLANADLLTNMDFARVLEFQHDQAFDIVICVKKHGVDIPYGVVDIDGPDVTAIREKPRHECFVNAGIYVVSPHCIDLVPEGRFFDMTDLVTIAIEKGMRVGAFPVIEYWRDIGTPADLAAASEDNWSAEEHPFQRGELARTA